MVGKEDQRTSMEGRTAIAKKPNARKNTANVSMLGCHVLWSVGAMTAPTIDDIYV